MRSLPGSLTDDSAIAIPLLSGRGRQVVFGNRLMAKSEEDVPDSEPIVALIGQPDARHEEIPHIS
jgi:hypothetical protein